MLSTESSLVDRRCWNWKPSRRSTLPACCPLTSSQFKRHSDQCVQSRRHRRETLYSSCFSNTCYLCDSVDAQLDTGRVHPRVGLGWVGWGPDFSLLSAWVGSGPIVWVTQNVRLNLVNCYFCSCSSFGVLKP